MGLIYPGVSKIREISVKIAAAVIKKAFEEGLTQLETQPNDLENFVRRQMYYPVYPEFAWRISPTNFQMPATKQALK